MALAILGLIAATVYLSLDGALSSLERVREAQDPYQRGRVARSFIASALRSAATFTGMRGDGFTAVDSSSGGMPRDELTFAAMAPGGAGSRMQLHLFVADSAGSPWLRLDVRPLTILGDSLPEYESYTLSSGVAGLEMEYLAAPAAARTSWMEQWDSAIRLPHAIRITFLPAHVPDPAYRVPLLVHIPAGRIRY